MTQKLLHLFLLTMFCVGILKSQESSEILQKKSSKRFSTCCKIIPESGIQYEKGVTRRDPSDIIKIGNKYYVWYTKVTLKDPGYPSGYHGTIYFATSTDRENWIEQGQALDRGHGEVWDGYGVFTPNILVANDQYYLFYTGVAPGFSNYPHNGYEEGPPTPTAIGVAVASSPDGPWSRFEKNPVLKPGEPGEWDDWRIDDACLITRENQYWLYYKGRQEFGKNGGTPMGLARADSPKGPFERCDNNPLIGPGHEVLVWPYKEGVAALVGGKDFWLSADGIQFKYQETLERGTRAAGVYKPDAFSNADYGKEFFWGITMQASGDKYFGFPEECLSVFECNTIK